MENPKPIATPSPTQQAPQAFKENPLKPNISNLYMEAFTLCLDSNLGKKRKKRKEKGGKKMQGKRNEREKTLVCLGGKRRKRKGKERKGKENKSFPFKYIQLWKD